MAISEKLERANLDELFLDPLNPRLGRTFANLNIEQEEILHEMRSWKLEELALSYIENEGFWTHEALLVVEEDLYGSSKLVVVEGNRRLAALKYLLRTSNDNPPTLKWVEFINHPNFSDELFSNIPFIRVDTRSDVQSFLGFRHVTGIKQWDADEKAGFIAHLIEENEYSYADVMRKIGSNTPTVRRLYIAYRVLLQIENTVEDFDPALAESRFTILYMSIDTNGAQIFLNLNIEAEPDEALEPVPDEKRQDLVLFTNLLFGTNEKLPLVTDTRQVSRFGKILESEEAIAYLRETPNPNFEIAFRVAGGDEDELSRYISGAADNVELALTRAHFYSDSEKLQVHVTRLGRDVIQLLRVFPEIYNELIDGE